MAVFCPTEGQKQDNSEATSGTRSIIIDGLCKALTPSVLQAWLAINHVFAGRLGGRLSCCSTWPSLHISPSRGWISLALSPFLAVWDSSWFQFYSTSVLTFGFFTNLSDKSSRKCDSWSIISTHTSSPVYKPSLEWKILWDFALFEEAKFLDWGVPIHQVRVTVILWRWQLRNNTDWLRFLVIILL